MQQCKREDCPEQMNDNVPDGGDEYCSVLCLHVDEMQKKLLKLLSERRNDAHRQDVLRKAWVASAELATAVEELRSLAVTRRQRWVRRRV